MKRFTYPTFVDCKPPSSAVKLSDGSYQLPIDLKEAFHHTYIDVHGQPPRKGTNPLFDEYEQLLDDTMDLRFIKPGIADDTESKIRESGKLGRGIARFILSEYYGYTWFGKIQNLLTSSNDGWTVERPRWGGNTPDWLISDGNSRYCLGEAKGTHSHIDLRSDMVKKWRKQCTNIVVKKDDHKRKIKSWLIATRFVTEDDSDFPEQLIEDPSIDGVALNDNDFPSLTKYIARDHLSRSLFRVANFQLGLRVQQENSLEKGTYQVLTWRPLIKELRHLTFIGKPIGHIENNLPLWYWRALLHLGLDTKFLQEFVFINDLFNSEIIFDGLAVNTVQNYFQGNYSPLAEKAIKFDNYPFVNLLNDGNILLPLSLIRPDKIISI